MYEYDASSMYHKSHNAFQRMQWILQIVLLVRAVVQPEMSTITKPNFTIKIGSTSICSRALSSKKRVALIPEPVGSCMAADRNPYTKFPMWIMYKVWLVVNIRMYTNLDNQHYDLHQLYFLLDIQYLSCCCQIEWKKVVSIGRSSLNRNIRTKCRLPIEIIIAEKKHAIHRKN